MINGYLAYSRYQACAELAHKHYGTSKQTIWADITTACIRLSLTERSAFPPRS